MSLEAFNSTSLRFLMSQHIQRLLKHYLLFEAMEDRLWSFCEHKLKDVLIMYGFEDEDWKVAWHPNIDGGSVELELVPVTDRAKSFCQRPRMMFYFGPGSAEEKVEDEVLEKA